VSRDGADQGGEEAGGFGRFLGSKGHEVGLCQLDLLVHVIAGRLSLAGPASRPDLRLDLVGIVVRRTPRFLHAGRFRGFGDAERAMGRFPRSSRRVHAESP
jgi:hypothetical protein